MKDNVCFHYLTRSWKTVQINKWNEPCGLPYILYAMVWVGVTLNFSLKYATIGGYIAVCASLSTEEEQV